MMPAPTNMGTSAICFGVLASLFKAQRDAFPPSYGLNRTKRSRISAGRSLQPPEALFPRSSSVGPKGNLADFGLGLPVCLTASQGPYRPQCTCAMTLINYGCPGIRAR